MSDLKLVSPRERVLVLRSMPWFSDVDRQDALHLAQHLEEIQFKSGTVLVAEGEPITTAYLLVEGEVDLFRNDEFIRTLSAPGTLGLVGVFANLDGAPGNIVARGDITCLAIEGEEIFHIWEQSFELTRQSTRYAASQAWLGRNQLPFDPENPPEATVGRPPEHRLDLIDKLEVQTRGLLFAKANLEAVAEISRDQREVHYKPGESIWQAGDAAGFMTYIMSGLVQVHQGGELKGTVGSDYTIGVYEALAEVGRGYSARAETDVVAIQTEISTLMEVFEDNHVLAVGLLGGIASVAVHQLWRL